MKKIWAAWVLFIGLICCFQNVQAFQIVKLSIIDASIAFPDSFTVTSREIDELVALARGVTKDSIINDLDKRGAECIAVNSSQDLFFEVAIPELDYWDYELLSDQNRIKAINMYKEAYANSGCTIEDIRFVDTPNTIALRIQGTVLLPSGIRHLIQYHFSYLDYSFYLQVVSDNRPFTENDLLLCEEIANTVRFGIDVFLETPPVKTTFLEGSGIEFAMPAFWYQSKASNYADGIAATFEPLDGMGLVNISYNCTDLLDVIQANSNESLTRNRIIQDYFKISNDEFSTWSIQSIISDFIDPKEATIYTTTLGNYKYIIAEFIHEWVYQNEVYHVPQIVALHVDDTKAYVHWFIYTDLGDTPNESYLRDFKNMITSTEYYNSVSNFPEASEIIRTAYNMRSFDENGFSIVTTYNSKGERRDGLIDTEGHLVVSPKAKRISKCNEGFYWIEGVDESFYVNTDGTLLRDDSWYGTSIFSNGLARIKEYGKKEYGYITSDGEIKIDTQFNEAHSFSEGLAAVRDTNGLIGYIDTKGEMVIKPSWDYGNEFTNGMASIFVGEINSLGLPGTGLFGFIDRQGNIISEPQWDGIGYYSNGLAMVKKADKYGYIDTLGNVVIEPQWEDATPFTYGLARVKKDNKYGFINLSGEIVIPCIWDQANTFQENGYACVFVKNVTENSSSDSGLWGLIDMSGNVVIEPIWENVFNYINGYAVIKRNGKSGLIDERGEVIIPVEWDDLSVPYEGLLKATKDGKTGYIDLRGKIIIDFTWDKASTFEHGLACVRKNNQWYVIDRSGNIVM